MEILKGKVIGKQSYVSKKDGVVKNIVIVSYEKDGVDGYAAGSAVVKKNYNKGDAVQVIETYMPGYGVRINVLEQQQ